MIYINPNANTVFAFNNETKVVVSHIGYDKTNQEPVLSMINSLYWNGDNMEHYCGSGKEIARDYSFLVVNHENIDLVKTCISKFYHYRNSNRPGSKKMALKFRAKIFNLAQPYKKEI